MATASSAPKPRPIIFSGPMVKLILNGHKTQTRRVVTWPAHYRNLVPDWNDAVVDPGGVLWGPGPYLKVAATEPETADPSRQRVHSPYGYPPDQLWVRETWFSDHVTAYDYDATRQDLARRGLPTDDDACHAEWRGDHEAHGPGSLMCYKADGEPYLAEGKAPWRSARYMPRWASRLLLEVTEVRVQRLHEITEADAVAELGPLAALDMKVPSVRDAFCYTWDELNARRGHAWDSNPWVWALTFRVMKP